MTDRDRLRRGDRPPDELASPTPTTRLAWTVFVLGLLVVTAPLDAATAGDLGWDYGDAPEGALAYPSTGQIGDFPTCVGGTAGFVRHGLGWAHFWSAPAAPPQPAWEPEPDGNAGVCPPPAYDLDECFDDGDAGLVTPTPYTIVGGVVMACPAVVNHVPLGQTCTMATITANVTNGMPVTGYINVLFDWNRDGKWSGQWTCADGVSAPEHAVVDDPIPPGFTGLWTSPPFLVGSAGDVYVWSRLEIANVTVGPGWDGQGDFEDGESEDYLVRVDLARVPTETRSWGGIKAMHR